jgi:4-alpha-glucanotransferase
MEDGESRAVLDLVPGDLPFGYHTFVADTGEQTRVISSPGRCYYPTDRRTWGWAAQVYASRSSQSWGIGDLADLRRLAEWSSKLGAGFVLINPIGATAPSGEPEPSPYFPTSRRFRSPLYLRVEEVAGAALAADDVAVAARAGKDLNRQRVIDRGEVWRLKRRALEAVWNAAPPLEEFDRWYARQPSALTQFATWSALADKHGPSWSCWPVDCRRPDGPGLASAPADGVRFHAWIQWLLSCQLDNALSALGIIQDLPIGVDPSGFDAWSWQNALALDASVGTPPDEFILDGQNWGLPPFVPWRLADTGYEPFIETIRASISSGGGLRIDHVMGLFRLWWIPAGADPGAGAFVRYPAEDLLARSSDGFRG